ncbi:hypothetical protein CJ030_MR2G026723 [Morella rubra]|uniref:Uncharacterized protein n=1 Tax=Morella rubra TaxID=262757 RepID=A0A6A1WDA6_9ROSI|nr:hypothetical protein CJ030_MR2G026723 [Morella rubra]
MKTKAVLKVNLDGYKRKNKALIALCGLPGVCSIALSRYEMTLTENQTLRHGRLRSLLGLCFTNPVDSHLIAMYAKDPLKLTVIGEGVDPDAIVRSLRKHGYAGLLSVGPAIEPTVGPAIEPNKRPVENIPRMTRSYSSSSSDEDIRNY